MYDKNGDGEITIDELGEAMRAAGETCTPEELKAMIRAVDINGNFMRLCYYDNTM